MNRVVKALLVVTVLTVCAWAQRPTSPEPTSDKTALEFLNQFKIGWNLGNVLDAHKNKQGTEGEWDWGGTGRVNPDIFPGVAAAGYEVMRIPVTWTGHIGGAPNYTVSQARLARVDSLINHAKAAGIKAMIINIHHDGLINSTNDNTMGFVDLKGSINNPTKKAEVEDQMAKVWGQIADYFKNYGDYLIFEVMNEVHIGNWGNSTGTQLNNERQILVDWSQAALNAIRKAGGNNDKRFVAVPTLGSTEPDMVVGAHNAGRLLPTDSLASGGTNSKRLIVSVHFYHPYQYTVMDNTNSELRNDDWKGIVSGNPGYGSTEAELTQKGNSMKTTFIDNGIAVYIGEWGAQNETRSSMNSTIQDNHVEYLETMATVIAKSGAFPIIWDDGGWFKLFDRGTGQLLPGFYTRVHNAVMKATEDNRKTTSVMRPSQSAQAGNISIAQVAVKGKTLNVSSPNNSEMKIMLIDAKGKVRASFNATGSGKFSLKRIPAGQYFVEIRTAGGKQTSPIVLK